MVGKERLKLSQGLALFKLKNNWFSLTLLLLLGFAIAKPEFGGEAGPLHPAVTRTLGVIVIFFVTGLTLRTRELKRGFTSGRLHVFVQGFGFIFIPLCAFLGVHAAKNLLAPEILQGILVLSILPTTITSCVVYTGLARGNVAGAVFNSVLGNLGGVVVSPLLFSLIIASGAGVVFDWTQIYAIVIQIILPLVAGLALRPLYKKISPAVSPYLPYVSGISLLAIVYFAFCSAFAPTSMIWKWSGIQLALPLATVLGLHLFFLGSAWLLSGVFQLGELDRRAALFIAPQKTIALGLPLIHFFFAKEPELAGLVSIPLIAYHPLQLLVAGFLAPRLAERPVPSMTQQK